MKKRTKGLSSMKASVSKAIKRGVGPAGTGWGESRWLDKQTPASNRGRNINPM